MRYWLPLLCAIGVLLGGAAQAVEPADGDAVMVDASSVVAYVESCRKPNGAFGPSDQDYTDAAWNFPAIETLLFLGEPIAQPQQILEHGLGYPHGHAGVAHLLFFHQHHIRQRLGKPIAVQARRVAIEHQGFKPRYYGSPLGIDADTLFKAGRGAESDALDGATTTFGYYNLSSLYYLLAGLQASGREPADPKPLVEYVRSRQAPEGGFVDVRSETSVPSDDEAHIAHTFFALASLKLLGQSLSSAERQRCIAFVQGCQTSSGGYRWNPQDSAPANHADVYYTWAALRSLASLGSTPRGSLQCLQWLNSLHNSDGGFGDQSGWRSRLYSTYYAVHSLALLGDNIRNAIRPKRVARPRVETISADGLQIYQALFKTPVVEPSDLPGLSRRGFNLLGLKSDQFDAAERLYSTINEHKLPLDVVLCPEAYPHRARGGGGLVLDHVGNFTLDPRWSAAQKNAWLRADQAGRQSPTWAQYQQRVLTPLRSESLCYPEQDFEQEHAYVAYAQGGYNAVLAGFNWAPRDFVRVFPWRERYVDRLTPVADADAHGDLPKWSPQLDHTRMLYIARGPSYAEFMHAASAQRVVCVIADPQGVPAGVSYYGPRSAVDFVKQYVDQWRWWPRP